MFITGISVRNLIHIHILLCSVFLSGCGVHPIILESEPSGAEVFSSGKILGTTPLVYNVSWWIGGSDVSGKLIEVAFPGYQRLPYDKSLETGLGLKTMVKSYPEGAEIVEDGRMIGSSPFKYLPLFPDYLKAIISNKNTNTKENQVTYKKNIVKHQKQISTSSRNNWAVIIGISQYQYSGQKNGLTNLIFADDDAKAFARSLCNLGWSESHMKLLTNEEATQRNIMIALKSWLTKAGPDDQIILFWAGHGYADPEDPEKVYLATYDTDISIPATGYRMDEVRKALEEIRSKNVVLFADTCHAGKLITRGNGNRGISIMPNIRKQSIPKGWIFMVGADTDRQAIEHTSWSNGAFTHSLIKGLNGEADGFHSAGARDGMVTMGELKDYMKTSMPDETQKVLGVAKHPVITTSTGDPGIWNMTLQVIQ